MSGAPPHHPHGRQAPPSNTAWNHLQVPNYFPTRQPQHAHMSNEHPLLPQGTWHAPTSDAMKPIPPPHSHVFNLDQMLSERSYTRHPPGPIVDLTLTRNGNQNGEMSTTPLSLSVRDTNKINSLPISALDIQAVELTKSLSPSLRTSAVSPGLKSISPSLKPTSPGRISTSPGIIDRQGSPKNVKKPKRMDSILERLNPMSERQELGERTSLSIDRTLPVFGPNPPLEIPTEKEKQGYDNKQNVQSVIVPLLNNMHDENSNSNSTSTVPQSNIREEDVVSPFSNEDSLDSTKSRRKRKPSKTVRVNVKEAEKIQMLEAEICTNEDLEKSVIRTEDLSEKSANQQINAEEKHEKLCSLPKVADTQSEPPTDTVPQTPKEENQVQKTGIDNTNVNIEESQISKEESKSKSVSVNVITVADICKMKEPNIDKDTGVGVAAVAVSHSIANESHSETKDDSISYNQETTATVVQTAAQRKATNFVEVENKLEEMFAGIEEGSCATKAVDPLGIDDEEMKMDDFIRDEVLKFDLMTTPSTSQNHVNVSSNDESNAEKKSLPVKRGKSPKSTDVTPKKKKIKHPTSHSSGKNAKYSGKKGKKSSLNGKQVSTKIDTSKDVYVYDSGSNASSVRSRGPFVQIRGPRDSPISVNVVNTLTEDEAEKKSSKPGKKFHDDSEYRHKVRSKGLHCSTLSNKYDAQTKDKTWICAFCKRGPHSTDPNIIGVSSFYSPIYAAGDLFGPYVITSKSPEYERRLDDPFDKQFKSKKISKALEITNVKATGKKSKRKHSEGNSLDVDVNDVTLGITETGEQVFEVWIHEDCVVWSPGVYLVGPKIVGLEEAVWTSCNVPCRRCNLRGANICCLKRGCAGVMHFGCAVISDWQLDDETFKALCVEHKTM